MVTLRPGLAVSVAGLLFTVVAACGSDKKADNTSTAKKLDFTTDINPIIIASCTGASGCHGTASKESGVYQGNEANFKKADVKTRLGLPKTDPIYMPKGSTSFADADKQKMLDFLAQ